MRRRIVNRDAETMDDRVRSVLWIEMLPNTVLLGLVRKRKESVSRPLIVPEGPTWECRRKGPATPSDRSFGVVVLFCLCRVMSCSVGAQSATIVDRLQRRSTIVARCRLSPLLGADHGFGLATTDRLSAVAINGRIRASGREATSESAVVIEERRRPVHCRNWESSGGCRMTSRTRGTVAESRRSASKRSG